MDSASLLPHGNEVGPVMARSLLVHASDAATCIIARRGLIADGLLTSLEEETQEWDVHSGQHRTAWLTRANPFVSDARRAKLDEDGVVRPGTILEPGDILASALESTLPRRGHATRPGMVWVCDHSWEVPAHWHGATVMEARVLGRAELGSNVGSNVRHRVCVRLHLIHSLAIGDLLVCHDFVMSEPARNMESSRDAPPVPIGIVGAFRADADMPRGKDGRPADLIVPTTIAKKLLLPLNETHPRGIGRAEQTGRQFAQVRAMDAGYSLITQQPFGGKWGPAQHISVAHVRWLLTRGLIANVGELASLKSDDLRHRAILNTMRRANNLTPDAVPAPGTPETLALLRSELMALGLAVSLEDAGHAVAITLRPAANEDVIANSSGAIRKPDTIHYKTLLDTEGGLFCPKVFGGDDHARRQRWGHLELPAPVVSPLWRFGSPSVLELLLGLNKGEIDAILNNEVWLGQENGTWQTVATAVAERKKGRVAEPGPGQLTGALAIEAMLRTAPPERIPPSAGCPTFRPASSGPEIATAIFHSWRSFRSMRPAPPAHCRLRWRPARC